MFVSLKPAYLQFMLSDNKLQQKIQI